MRYSPEQVHPALFDAAKRAANGLATGYTTGATDKMQAYMAHQKIWWKEYGKSTILMMVLFIAQLVGTIAMGKALGKPVLAVAFIACLAIWAAVLVVMLGKNQKILTLEELKVLTPVIDLTPVQKVYADALVLLEENELPKESKDEVMRQMYRLVDEEIRLTKLRDRGVTAPTTLEEIDAERAKIEAKIASSTDPVSRDALQKSLEMAEARRSAARELSLVEERVDAQLSMVDQAIRGIRDGLRRMRATPTATTWALDLDEVRRSVDQAHEHATALERAVEEVRTLA